MATSQTSWIQNKNIRFINPYNFVGLGSGVERKEKTFGELTGKISCTLEMKTPCAVPDSEKLKIKKIINDKKKEIEHKEYPFFRVGDMPVIPGSQIRGVIRSAYETLSNSCLSVNNVDILSSRNPTPKVAGIIQFKEGRYRLFAARKYRDKGQDFNKDTDVRRQWYDIRKTQKIDFIFSKTSTEIECLNLDEAIKDYKENVEIYKKQRGSYLDKLGNTDFLKIRSDGGLYPVFYELVYDAEDKEKKPVVHLSPSQIGRTVYKNKVTDLLGTYASCSHSDGAELCKACSLFGIIANKNHASRVRFADAVLISDSFKTENFVTLKPLSSPKITSVEFYSSRPEKAVMWSYDDKTTAYVNGRNTTMPEKTLCEVELRGRKFYLHNPNIKKEDYEGEKSNQNATMELASAGNRFSFDVFFEKITQEELNELVWCLTIGENDLVNGKQMHKLGHGKPLGLGSVKIVADSVEIRRFDKETFEYSIEKLSPDECLKTNPFDENSRYFKEFMTITNFETAKGGKISYPIADDCRGSENSKAAHQWFVANRSYNGTTMEWDICYTLPKVRSKDLSLPAYEKSGAQKSEKYKQKSDKSRGNIQFYSSGDSGGGGFFSNIKTKKK